MPLTPTPCSFQHPLFIHRKPSPEEWMSHSMSHRMGTGIQVSCLTVSCVFFSVQIFVWYFSFLAWMNFRFMNLPNTNTKEGVNHSYNGSGSRRKDLGVEGRVRVEGRRRNQTRFNWGSVAAAWAGGSVLSYRKQVFWVIPFFTARHGLSFARCFHI